MKKVITKLTAIVLIVTTSFMMSGCYGSFALVSGLHDWNGRVSNSKFVNELVFLGLCIIPVYEIAALGDALIFNSIEFWGGSNPISMNEGEVEESEMMHEGHKYQIIKSKNSMTIACAETVEKAEFKYFPKEKSWYLMEGEEKSKVVEMKDENVFTYLPNSKTLVFDKNSADIVEREVMASK